MPRSNPLQSSLFPFMSVLACTIGALVVLLAIMSLSSVEASDEASVTETKDSPTVVDRRALAQQLARPGVAEIAKLEEAEALWKKVDEELVNRGFEAGLSAFEIVRTLESAHRSRALENQQLELEAEIEELSKQGGELQTTLEVLRSRRDTLPILIDPTGLSPKWKPHFVECDGEGITAYRVTDDFRYFVPIEEVEMAGSLARYLRRVRVEPNALLVLLVRPDGLKTAKKMKALATSVNITGVARLPLPGRGEIDWELLRRAEGAS